MNQFNVPLVADFKHFLELPNGHFINIDLVPNANGDWVVEHLDATGEFVCGIQIAAPESKSQA